MPIHPPSNRRPYDRSAVPVDRTKEEIGKLLRDYGARAVNWAEDFTNGNIQLQFAIDDDEGRTLRFRITPAAFMEPHKTWDALKGIHVTKTAPNWARSMRLLLAWLKTKLESIAFGLTSVEEEFLAQTVIRDSRGVEATVGDVVLPAIAGGHLALEAPARPKPIRVEGEVVR